MEGDNGSLLIYTFFKPPGSDPSPGSRLFVQNVHQSSLTVPVYICNFSVLISHD